MTKFIICNNDNMIYYRGRVYAMGDDRYIGAEEFLDKTYPTKEQATKIAGKLGNEWQVKEVNESLKENKELKEMIYNKNELDNITLLFKPEVREKVEKAALAIREKFFKLSDAEITTIFTDWRAGPEEWLNREWRSYGLPSLDEDVKPMMDLLDTSNPYYDDIDEDERAGYIFEDLYHELYDFCCSKERLKKAENFGRLITNPWEVDWEDPRDISGSDSDYAAAISRITPENLRNAAEAGLTVAEYIGKFLD